MLVEGEMVSGDRRILEMLRMLYKTGLDPQGCAITQGPRGEGINNLCAPVHNEICKALADLGAVYRQGPQSRFCR